MIPGGVKATQQPAGNHYRVLIVEDARAQQILVKKILSTAVGLSFETSVVGNLSDAVSVLQIDSSFDAVLLDLGLPDSSGLNTLLRVTEAAPNVAVVVLTAASEDDLGAALIQNGAQDYLEKSGVENKLLLIRALRYAIERKHLEQQIAERERLFLGFMENNPAAAFVQDENGHNLYANRQFEHFFGSKMSRTDTGSMLIRMVRDQDLNILRSGSPIENIETIRDPSGIMRNWLIIKFAFEDTIGRSLVGGTAMDVTELEESREALRQSRELFRVYFYESTNPLAIIGTDYKIRCVNRAFCRLTGYTETELFSKTVQDLMVEMAPDPHSKIFDDQHAVHLPGLSIINKAGVCMSIDRTAVAVRNLDGEPLFGFLMDAVQDKSRVAVGDTDCSELFAGMVSNSLVGAMRLDAHNCILEVNQLLCEQLDLQESLLIGKPLFTYFDFGTNEFIQNVLFARKPWKLEVCRIGFLYPLKMPDSDWRLSVSPIPGGESVLQISPCAANRKVVNEFRDRGRKSIK